MVIILFGAPGVGKGTQAALLSERLNIAHLSTGDALRNAIKNETEVGKLAKRYVDAGDLVPDDIVTRIVEETLSLPQYTSSVILDGFPRSVAQAEALDGILDRHKKSISYVINVAVDNDEIVQRLLQRGRKDDTEEIIRHRMNVYNNETAPLLDFYGRMNGVLRHVDGNAEVEEVYHRITTILSPNIDKD